MSARKVMFIEPAMSISALHRQLDVRGHRGSGAVGADQVFGPDGVAMPVSRSRTRTSTPSASWVCDRYSVENRVWVPRMVALLTRIGSR